MTAEPNWWSGQSGPSSPQNQNSSENKTSTHEVVPPPIEKKEEPETSNTFLSSDKSGHWVPDAYQKMLERMKKENPKVEPKKEDVLSRVAEEEKSQNDVQEQPISKPEPKIGGSAKYLNNLRAALQTVIDGSSSMNLVMPIRDIKKVEFKKAGKNKEGEIIYEVCEENVTLGYADYTIYS